MVPVSIALISDIFPAEKRGVMIGGLSFIQLLANILSPILGSIITKQLGWHWIFYITLVMVVVAMFLVSLARQATRVSQSIRWSEIDLVGGLVFGVFCVLTVNFSNVVSGQSKLGITGVLLLIGAITTAIILVWNERRHKDPIIKVAFFRSKILRRSIISSIVAGGIMYGLVTILPLCGVVLKQQGFNIDESKILMLFMLGSTFGLLIASRLVTKLNANFPKTLWGVSVLSAGLMYYAISASNLLMFYIVTGILGLLLGGIMATLLINSQNAVSSEDRTVLSGLVQLGRYLGAAIGVTILTGMLPEVSQISTATQFLGAFGLLVGIYILGLINELI
jgi:MFS family permease